MPRHGDNIYYKTGRDKYFRQKDRELRELLSPATGMLSPKHSRTIVCPLCNGKNHKQIFIKNGYRFVKCTACRLIFANPQILPDILYKSYRRGNSNDLWIDVLTSTTQMKADTQKFHGVLNTLDDYLPHGSTKRILDIGCSIGLFLHLAKKRGWEVFGLELGDRAISYAKKHYNLSIHRGLLDDTDYKPGYFDGISTLALLEHLNSPLTFLNRVHELLRPGGMLAVITPNVESLACRILHSNAATFDGRNHLIYFSPHTLSRLLRKAGFKILHMETHVPSLTPVFNHLQYRSVYEETPAWGDPLVRFLIESSSGKNWNRLFKKYHLGYKIHCFAQKISKRHFSRHRN